MKEVFIINFEKLKKPLKTQGLEVICFKNENDTLAEIDDRRNKSQDLPTVILYNTEAENLHPGNPILKCAIPVIIVSDEDNSLLKQNAKKSGAIDFYSQTFNVEAIALRINAITSLSHPKNRRAILIKHTIPVGKRIFDIAVSSFLILLLMPLFTIISLLIRFGSKGPVFYSSPRVGTGYKIFPFYKFRSMRVNADQLLKNMKHLNHYQSNPIAEEIPEIKEEGPMLVGDDQFIPETTFISQKEKEDKQAFMKINNDPRITKVGHFIRKTSIDELPQLFNVLLGHMSIVGNRPLPLYEAEKLTSDDWALRFLAPAGITGLWQVTERGKSSTSEDSRKELDVIYAKKYSVWMDLKILLKTPLALFQQEDV